MKLYLINNSSIRRVKKMSSRTLGTLIKDKRYKHINLKIRSIKGSSFWLCRQNHAHLDDEIYNKWLYHKRKQKKALESAKYRLANLDTIYEERIAKQLEKGVKDPVRYRAGQERRKEIERKQLPNKIKQYEYDIATSFLDRPVKATYNGLSPDEMPCLIVYVLGGEQGSYWTIKEYMKRNSKNDYES